MQTIGTDGLGYLPYLTALFFFIFFSNITEIIPGVQFPANARFGMPAVLRVVHVGHLQRRRRREAGAAPLPGRIGSIFPPPATWNIIGKILMCILLRFPIEFLSTVPHPAVLGPTLRQHAGGATHSRDVRGLRALALAAKITVDRSRRSPSCCWSHDRIRDPRELPASVHHSPSSQAVHRYLHAPTHRFNDKEQPVGLAALSPRPGDRSDPHQGDCTAIGRGIVRPAAPPSAPASASV